MLILCLPSLFIQPELNYDLFPKTSYNYDFYCMAVLTRIEVLKKLGSGSILASSLKIIRNFLQILSIKLISICKQFYILSLRYQYQYHIMLLSGEITSENYHMTRASQLRICIYVQPMLAELSL